MVRLLTLRLLGPTWLAFTACCSCWGFAELAPGEIVRRSVAVNNRDFRVNPSYSDVERDVDQKAGDRTDRSYEVFLMDGSNYRKLVAIDGQPLSAAQQKQEEQKMRHELARRRAESPEMRAARIRKYQADRDHDHLLMTQMAVAFTFRLLGREKLQGHDTYVLDAEPNPKYRPVNREAKVLTGMHGKMWIDAAHFHWVRVEAEVFRPVTFAGFLARVGPGTRFELTNEPVGDDIWQPSEFRMSVVASVLFFSKNSTSTQIFKDYRANGAMSSLMPRPDAPGGALRGPLSATGNRADP